MERVGEPPQQGGFLFAEDIALQRILRTRVFNTFVENAVENERGVVLTVSARDASALCTEGSASTLEQTFGSELL